MNRCDVAQVGAAARSVLVVLAQPPIAALSCVCSLNHPAKLLHDKALPFALAVCWRFDQPASFQPKRFVPPGKKAEKRFITASIILIGE
jgi:hypothetical protein